MEVELREMKVLVVDDQLAELMIISAALESLCNVVTTPNSHEAIALAKEHQPDVIILDIEMPEMNGFELCQSFQAVPEFQQCSYIFITSHTAPAYEAKALEMGAADFIHKPIDINICKLRVKNQLRLLFQEKSLTQAYRALHSEKEYFNKILFSMGDAVIAVDESQCVSFINPVAERLTGWKANLAVGEPINRVMQLQDATTNINMINPLEVAMSQRRTVAMALNAKITSRDGKEFRVEDSASPILDQSGENVIGGVIIFQDVTDAIAMSTQMTHLTNHDQLTGLPNRILLYDRMLQAIKKVTVTKRIVAVLLIDIDNFKDLNDTFGHDVGDDIIKHVATLLMGISDDTMTVSRIGGDEFVILITESQTPADVNHIADSVLRSLKSPFFIEDEAHRLSVSMGISLYPHDALTPEDLMRHADTAMYKVKSEGKNGYTYYSDELFDGLQEKVRLQKLIHRRLEEYAIVVHFQPKVNLETKKLVGVEALSRLLDDNGQIVSPYRFIPIAEESSLIIELGNQVLDICCQQAKAWMENDCAVTIAVNIGASQFNSPAFIKSIAAVLNKYDLPAHFLELEITESALIANVNTAKDTIDALQQMGVTVALDDFGTGYSSLSYLRRFNFDVLKIDRSFVMDIEQDAQARNIIDAMIKMAETLGLEVICEGIETVAQLRALKNMGCIVGQGYLFSHPLSKNEIEKEWIYSPRTV